MGASSEAFIAMREKEQSLFDITLEQKSLINKIEELEGEITPEMEEQLKITEGQLQHKTIAYLEVIKKKEAFNNLIDNEVKRLQQMKKVNNNLVDRLKDNLLMAVKTFGTYTVGTQKFGTRKSSRVIVEDVNSLPSEFKTIKVTEEADKNAIKSALKAGKEIEGCFIQENLNLKIN
jgi:hypothetical protein